MQIKITCLFFTGDAGEGQEDGPCTMLFHDYGYASELYSIPGAVPGRQFNSLKT